MARYPLRIKIRGKLRYRLHGHIILSQPKKHKMNTLKNNRKVESGKIFNAYFEACENDKLYRVLVEKGLPFGRGYKTKEYSAFEWNGKTFAVLGYDHYNGHFSGFTD